MSRNVKCNMFNVARVLSLVRLHDRAHALLNQNNEILLPVIVPGSRVVAALITRAGHSGLADWNLDCPLDFGLDFEMEF